MVIVCVTVLNINRFKNRPWQRGFEYFCGGVKLWGVLLFFVHLFLRTQHVTRIAQ